MIKPTIGRKVWWWQHGEAAGHQPEDATVVFVHGDHCVNLRVTDHEGRSRSVLAAHLVQDGDANKPIMAYATWMPFQLGQARARQPEPVVRNEPDVRNEPVAHHPV